MRKAKRHMNFSAEFVTPEQKLEEISFLEDHKYNFGSWTNRQTKFNGWVNEDNLNGFSEEMDIKSMQNSVILGKSVTSATEKSNHFMMNKSMFLTDTTNQKKRQKSRSHSAQLPSKKSFHKTEQLYPKEIDKKMPFQFLKKKSGKELSSKTKLNETTKYSIEGINYPIFQMNNISPYVQKVHNPIMSKIRLLMKHRRHNSNL